MSPAFTRQTLSFLRSLKRNNDREWFKAHRAQYERHVQTPMLAVIERLAADLPAFAPELACDPRTSLYRIYRDTRFSADKSPLKTHIAAHFPRRGQARGAGAALYFEVAPGWVWIGGGLYMPSPDNLRAVRSRIASTHPRLHRLVTAQPFTRIFGEMTGEQLSRVPRGFAADHPAARYLKYRQFIGGRELPAGVATSPRFYRTLLETFRAVVPLVRFLNTALLDEPGDDARQVPVTAAALPGHARAPRHEPMW